MANVITVEANEVPSRLLGTGIETFDMDEFCGKDIIALGAATMDKSLTARTEIFYGVISQCIQDKEVVDHLTVNDVWYLVLLQWKQTNRSLIVRTQCTAPVYSVAGETNRLVYTAADVGADDEVVSVDPCGGTASTQLTFDDIVIAYCDPEVYASRPEHVHLPYANQLDGEPYLEDKSTYLSLWIDDVAERSLPEISKACEWVQAMQHGVITLHQVRCSTCGRIHSAQWALSVESFTL